MFFQPKCTDSFLISPQKHMLWCSLEAPQWGTSNDYPQYVFSWRNKKNIMWIPLSSGAMQLQYSIQQFIYFRWILIHFIDVPLFFDMGDNFWNFLFAFYCTNTLLKLILPASLKRVTLWEQSLFVLRFYGPVNPIGSCRARSVYLTTRLLGRPSPLSG